MTFIKSFLKMLLSFAPWLFFLIIAQHSMFRLKLGIIGAAVLTVVMAVTRLHRGVIMWVGILFFSCAIVAVVFMNDMWAYETVSYSLMVSAMFISTWYPEHLRRRRNVQAAHAE